MAVDSQDVLTLGDQYCAQVHLTKSSSFDQCGHSVLGPLEEVVGYGTVGLGHTMHLE